MPRMMVDVSNIDTTCTLLGVYLYPTTPTIKPLKICSGGGEFLVVTSMLII